MSSTLKTGVGIGAIVLGFMFGLALINRFLPQFATTAQGNLIAK